MGGGCRQVMLAQRTIIFSRCSIVVVATVFGGTIVFAEEDAAQPDDEKEVLEEMVIIAGEKSGDPVDLDVLYEEKMRERVMLEQKRLRALEEEDEWRNLPSTTVEGPARITWGYDPKDELEMRRESNMFDIQPETRRPATVFKVGF